MQFFSGCPFDLSFVNFLNIKYQISNLKEHFSTSYNLHSPANTQVCLWSTKWITSYLWLALITLRERQNLIANCPIGQAQVFKCLSNPTPYTEKLNFQLGVVKPKNQTFGRQIKSSNTEHFNSQTTYWTGEQEKKRKLTCYRYRPIFFPFSTCWWTAYCKVLNNSQLLWFFLPSWLAHNSNPITDCRRKLFALAIRTQSKTRTQ